MRFQPSKLRIDLSGAEKIKEKNFIIRNDSWFAVIIGVRKKQADAGKVTSFSATVAVVNKMVRNEKPIVETEAISLK